MLRARSKIKKDYGYLCIFSVFIYAFCMRNIFGAIVLKLRFKIDVVVMII